MQRRQSRRTSRMSELIWHEVAKIINHHINDPRLQSLNITSVSLSSDLRKADIYFLISQQSDVAGVEKALARAGSHVRKLLAQRCSLKYVPALSFHHDEVLLKADKVNALLSEVEDQAEAV